jgi:predicted RNA-binding protein YlqC (UPF0109 family)
MTTTATNPTKEILRDLFGFFLMHPEEMKIEPRPLDGGTLWQMKGHLDDEPILVGKKGSHVRAIAFLIENFGRARGEVYSSRLYTERKESDRPGMKPRAAMDYDPTAANELLTRILTNSNVGTFGVAVEKSFGSDGMLTFTFLIRLREAGDYEELTVPAKGQTETLVGSIGTLFRAVAKKAGVEFEIAVEKP